MDAADVARRFDLGAHARLSDGPVARGRQGVVWRLDTVDGRWAVKETFQPVSEDEVRSATELQESARALGVPTPAVRRTPDGRVLATSDGRQVRVYEWVDLLPPDARLDPETVGEVVARIHRAGGVEAGPVDG